MFKLLQPFYQSQDPGGGDPPAQPPTEKQEPPTGKQQSAPPSQKPFEKFEDFLGQQGDDIKKLFESHVSGLKSALEKERKRTGADITPEDREAFDKWKSLVGTDNDPYKLLDAEKLRALNLERALTQKANEYRDILKEKSFDDAMIELDYWFVSEAAQNDAVALLDKYDLGDNFEKMEDALKQMAKERSHLFLTPEKMKKEDTETKGSGTSRRTEMKKVAERQQELKRRFRLK